MRRITTAKLSSRSQVLVPGPVREALVIGPGDRIEFVIGAGAVVIRRVRSKAQVDPFAVFDEWASPEDEKAFADL